jgi:hypothetical protein
MGRFVARLLAVTVLGVCLEASQAGFALASQNSPTIATRPAATSVATTSTGHVSSSPKVSSSSSVSALSASSSSSWLAALTAAEGSGSAKPAVGSDASKPAKVADSGPLSITTASLPDATQGSSYDEYIFATGGTTPYTWSVSSGSLPAGLSLDPSAGDISGTPTGTGTSTFTVEVTDSSTPTALTATQTFTIDVTPSPLTVADTEPPAATQGADYDYYLSFTGGVAPYSFSVLSGSLPAGLTLDPNYGDISGTPTGTGTSMFTVEITDSSTPTPQSVTQTYTLTVNPPAPLVITTTTLPAGSVGGSYDQFLSATGGIQPYAWSVSSGSLPAGLSLDPTYGEISGTPTGAGTSTFTVEVTDSSTPTARTATQTFTLSVTTPAPLAITTTSLPGATQGTYYDETISATGGNTPYAWSVPSGSLPAGLSLDPYYGYVYGTPTGTGTSTFTVQLTDSTSPTPVTVTQSFTLAVAAAPPLAITTTTLPAGSVGGGYNETLDATGGVQPYTWSVSSGSLPAGLSLDPTYGEISGTPTGAGTSTFTVEVTDSSTPTAQTATQSYTLSVTTPAPLVITTTSLPRATQGTYYDETISATGGNTPYAWSVSAGSLPAGLSLDPYYGYVYGTPTGTGTSTFTVQLTDSTSPTPVTVTQSFTLAVAAAPPLAITTSTIPSALVGGFYDVELYYGVNGGVAPYTWTVSSGSLPAGLTLSPDGELSGIPTAAGTSTFTIEVTDSSTPTARTATQSYTLTVATPAPLVISPLLSPMTQGTYSLEDLTATGGVPSYTWSITSGSLPAGLTLDPGGDIYGTPTGTGTSTFTLEVTDGASPTAHTASQTFTLTVIRDSILDIPAGQLPGDVVGESYDTQLQATGGVPAYTWSVSAGSLPAGLTLSSQGVLSGTPTATGTTTFTIKSTDSSTPTAQTATRSFTLAVTAPAALEITTTTADLEPVAQGVGYEVSLFASGGVPQYTWSVSAGSLPAGLTLDPNYGYIEGTPTGSGPSTFTLEVTDSASPTPHTATQSYTLTVAAASPLGITTTSLPAASLDSPYNEGLLASGGDSAYTWSVSSGSLPTGLSLDPNYGEVSGTPTATGTSTFTVEVTDTSTPTAQTATRSFTLTVTAPAALEITTTTADLEPVTQGVGYDTLLDASGGIPDYTWSLASGSLPAGLYLESGGYLYGMPTGSGTSTFTLEVTDSTSPTPDTATQSYTLTVTAAPPLTVNSTPLQDGTVGSPYGANLEGSGGGGSYTWSLVSGSLPAGLVLYSYGEVYGIPATAGTWTFTAEVTDDLTPTSQTAMQSFTLTVNNPVPLVITSGPQGTATAGTYYQADLGASGGDQYYTWAVTSGSLPPGLALDPVYGEIYGTPTTSGAYTFTLQAADDGSTPQITSQSYTITVGAVAPLAITTTSLAGATAGAVYDVVLGASGGFQPYTWSLASGSLPAGLSLDSGGGIFGTPTAVGTSSFTVEVTDSSTPTPQTVTKSFTITVGAVAPLAITTTSPLAGATTGTSYDVQLAAAGGVPSYTWSLASGSVPAGLSLYSDGEIFGTPTAVGTSSFTVEVTDSSTPTPQTVTKSFTLTVTAAGSLAITTTSLASATVGSYYQEELGASGGFQPYTWSLASGSLPAGLTLDAAGYFYGTPTAAGTSSFTVEVTDSLTPTPKTVTKSLTLSVTSGTSTPTPQTITFTAPASGTVGGTATLSATGGGSGNPVVFSVDSSSGAGVCAVSGTNGSTVSYTGAGDCVIDANQAGNASYSAAPQVQQTIVVGKAAQAITFTAPASGTVGGTATLSATGGRSGNPVVFSVDASSGAGVCVVSGTNGTTLKYTGVGTCVVDASQAGNANYSAAPQVRRTITVGKAAQSISFAPPASGAYGGTATLTATGGGSGNPVVFSVDASSGAGVCVVSGTNGTTLKYTGVGTCVVDASQAGNANYSAAPQVRRTITVGKAASKTSLTLSGSSVAWGNEKAITFTVAVSPQIAGTGTPTGTVKVVKGSTTLCSGTLSKDKVTCTLGSATTLAPGTYSLTATYAGNNTLAASNSAAVTLKVTKEATTAKLTISASSVTDGHEKSLVFTVTVTAQYSGTPAGTITITAGKTTVCKNVTLSKGKITCSPASNTTLSADTYSVVATYSGNTDFAASSSAAKPLKVIK